MESVATLYIIPKQMYLSLKTSLVLALVVCLYTARVRSQGLFPPLYSPLNFATSEPVTATSTCDECIEEEEGCGTCNSTCPFGNSLPPPRDLMSTGMLQEGIVSTIPAADCNNYTVIPVSDHSR